MAINMELMVLVNRHKDTIFKVVVILFALMVANSIYKKQVSAIEKLKNQNEMETKKIEVLQNISLAEKKLNAYKSLLVKKEAGTIINTINNIAKESGVRIISVRPGQEQKYQAYVKAPFHLVLSTPDYHALGKFINKIESNPDVYLVESVEIKSRILSGPTKDSELKKELDVSLIVSSVAFIN
jgi:Tfp pilus assembly protein PilO